MVAVVVGDGSSPHGAPWTLTMQYVTTFHSEWRTEAGPPSVPYPSSKVSEQGMCTVRQVGSVLDVPPASGMYTFQSSRGKSLMPVDGMVVRVPSVCSEVNAYEPPEWPKRVVHRPAGQSEPRTVLLLPRRL